MKCGYFPCRSRIASILLIFYELYELYHVLTGTSNEKVTSTRTQTYNRDKQPEKVEQLIVLFYDHAFRPNIPIGMSINLKDAYH